MSFYPTEISLINSEDMVDKIAELQEKLERTLSFIDTHERYIVQQLTAELYKHYSKMNIFTDQEIMNIIYKETSHD